MFISCYCGLGFGLGLRLASVTLTFLLPCNSCSPSVNLFNTSVTTHQRTVSPQNAPKPFSDRAMPGLAGSQRSPNILADFKGRAPRKEKGGRGIKGGRERQRKRGKRKGGWTPQFLRRAVPLILVISYELVGLAYS